MLFIFDTTSGEPVHILTLYVDLLDAAYIELGFTKRYAELSDRDRVFTFDVYNKKEARPINKFKVNVKAYEPLSKFNFVINT